MKPQEINWNEWEEIDNSEYLQLSEGYLYSIPHIKYVYFKKKEVFPKVFTNCNCSNKITVTKDGEIKLEGSTFKVHCCLKSLIEAVECAKKQMEKNK